MAVVFIVGLGNPGLKYKETRHNIGFDLVNAYASSLQLKWKLEPKFKAEIAKHTHEHGTVYLMKPQTYMNDSGVSVGAFVKYHRLSLERLIVVYDDITLPFARSKLSVHGGSGGHNGIESIFNHAGRGFIRYRVGIGAKTHPQMDLADYVLTRISSLERQLLDSRMSRFIQDLKLIVDKGVVHAMNQINQKEEPSKTHESDKHET